VENEAGHIAEPHKTVQFADCATHCLVTSTEQRKLAVELSSFSDRTTEIFIEFLKLAVKDVHQHLVHSMRKENARKKCRVYQETHNFCNCNLIFRYINVNNNEYKDAKCLKCCCCCYCCCCSSSSSTSSSSFPSSSHHTFYRQVLRTTIDTGTVTASLEPS